MFGKQDACPYIERSTTPHLFFMKPAYLFICS